ncbi:hypothetical protein BDV95DRAFT_605181 [Massariosphaeria phaeospora]|uniref:Uncharacterized protein n=1 Tax=Massariosphaeria phaeospora TaxID=100035 RepID=A0A7C8MCR0_9PLEO|nr:hypothetical protein BDV95DRAFT_605181 [Massariosphaeria phaeospora]
MASASASPTRSEPSQHLSDSAPPSQGMAEKANDIESSGPKMTYSYRNQHESPRWRISRSFIAGLAMLGAFSWLAPELPRFVATALLIFFGACRYAGDMFGDSRH